MNDMTGERERGNRSSRALKYDASFLILGPVPDSLQVLMSPRTCQPAPLFVFQSNVGTDLDKGDSRVYFLHLEAWNGEERNSRLVLPASWKQ